MTCLVPAPFLSPAMVLPGNLTDEPAPHPPAAHGSRLPSRRARTSDPTANPSSVQDLRVIRAVRGNPQSTVILTKGPEGCIFLSGRRAGYACWIFPVRPSAGVRVTSSGRIYRAARCPACRSVSASKQMSLTRMRAWPCLFSVTTPPVMASIPTNRAMAFPFGW